MHTANTIDDGLVCCVPVSGWVTCYVSSVDWASIGVSDLLCFLCRLGQYRGG